MNDKGIKTPVLLMTGGAWSALLISVAACFLFFALPFAEAAGKGIIESSGIRYPEGFDPNTVGEVQGTVTSFEHPDEGPVWLSLDTEQGTYIVILSPRWYWDDLGADIGHGEELSVVGSKTMGRDSKLYIIAEEMRILSSGRELSFRLEDGRPLWRGNGPGSGVRRGAVGPSSGPRMGNGMGGHAGPGRR